MASDAELVEQSRLGQLAAYEQLVRRWSARVYSYVRAKVGFSHVAEELAQETFLRGFRSLASLAEPAKFGAWLLSIAHRLVLDWRKARSRSEVSMSAMQENGEPIDRRICSVTDSPASRLESAEQKSELWKQVGRLPEELREVLLVYYCKEMSYQQIAEILDVSVPTVGVRLSKARKLLRERMSADAGIDPVTN